MQFYGDEDGVPKKERKEVTELRRAVAALVKAARAEKWSGSLRPETAVIVRASLKRAERRYEKAIKNV